MGEIQQTARESLIKSISSPYVVAHAAGKAGIDCFLLWRETGAADYDA